MLFAKRKRIVANLAPDLVSDRDKMRRWFDSTYQYYNLIALWGNLWFTYLPELLKTWKSFPTRWWYTRSLTCNFFDTGLFVQSCLELIRLPVIRRKQVFSSTAYFRCNLFRSYEIFLSLLSHKQEEKYFLPFSVSKKIDWFIDFNGISTHLSLELRETCSWYTHIYIFSLVNFLLMVLSNTNVF